MGKKILVSPSILSADFVNLERDIKKAELAGADWVHVDVMDGHFVPNITIGIPVVKALRGITNLPLDVHLMIDKPERYVEGFVKAGADIITIHVEATEEPIETLKKIKSLSKKAGISIKPKTSVDEIKDLIQYTDMTLVMTVEPGFGGQKFMTDCVSKISDVAELSDKLGMTDYLIQVDGGIDAETSKIVKEAGANVLVAGSYVYNSDDIKLAIDSLK